MQELTYDKFNIFWITSATSGFLVILLIFILFSCVTIRNFLSHLCQNKSRNQFKDYDNEGGFFNDISIATIPPVEFAMYPPTVSAFDATTSAVYFEPLPDILSRYKSQRKSMGLTNDSKLRPTINRSSRLDRQDSEDDVIDADDDDTTKLERIFEQNISSFPRSQLQYIQEMGITLSGKVLQGEAQNLLPGYRKAKVAVSMLKEDADVRSKVIFLQEVEAYREVEHNNVLKLYHQCIDTVPLLNILEYCPLGNLKSYIRNQKSSLSELNKRDLLLSFACDMAAGLNALHQRNFVHRDFALRNCLLTQDLIVKVGDYGLAHTQHREDYVVDGDDCYMPLRWMAPETVQFTDNNNVIVHTITKEANTWSFGVTLWELLSLGDKPYSKYSDEVLKKVIVDPKIKLQKPRSTIEHIDQMYELMELCWSRLASDRPTIRELRIMILHLKSSSNQMDTYTFEQKWNQLMPREKKESFSFECIPTIPTDYSPTPSLAPFAGSIQASNSTRRSDSPMTTLSEFNLGSEGHGVHIINAPANLSLADELNLDGRKQFNGRIRHDTDDDDFEVVSMSASGDKDLETDPADIYSQPSKRLPTPVHPSNKLIVEVHRTAAGEGSNSFGSPSMKSGDSFQIISSNEIDASSREGGDDKFLHSSIIDGKTAGNRLFLSMENASGDNTVNVKSVESNRGDKTIYDTAILNSVSTNDSTADSQTSSISKTDKNRTYKTAINDSLETKKVSEGSEHFETNIIGSLEILNVDAQGNSIDSLKSGATGDGDFIRSLEGEILLSKAVEDNQVEGFSEGFHEELLLQHSQYLNTVALDGDEI